MYIDETRIFISLIALSVIAAGIVGYVVYSRLGEYKRYRRMQEDFEKDRLRQLEKERQLIALDLHDDVNTVLTHSLQQLKEIEPNTEKHTGVLENVKNNISDVCNRLRNISSLLVPRSVVRRGPFYALEEFRTLYGKKGAALGLEIVDAQWEDLPEEQSLHLFRMLQEIYLNALKHSGGSKLVVKARREKDLLLVDAADDGKGFEMKIFSETFGFGLKSLAIRAQLINAKLYACSQPGKGTNYKIEMCINNK
jgi:signal transduction histidine kinase